MFALDFQAGASGALLGSFLAAARGGASCWRGGGGF
jgi:hypothetical protein